MTVHKVGFLQPISAVLYTNLTNQFPPKCFHTRKANPTSTYILFLLTQEKNRTTSEEIINSNTCRTEDNLFTKIVTSDLSKNPDCLYRLHVQILSKKVRALNRDSKTLRTKLSTLQDFISKTTYDKIAEIRETSYTGFKKKMELGTMFTFGKIFPVSKKVHWSLRSHKLKAVKRIINKVIDIISNAHHENIEFHALYYGYVLNRPISGLVYMMNIFTNKERHVTRSKQMFGAIQSRILKTTPKIVTIVTPLAGKLSIFKQFMKNIEENILKKQESINIIIAFFPQNTSYTEHKIIFERYKMTYKGSTFTWLNLPGKFARAKALQAAVEFNKDNTLLFFADVDLTFNTEFLQRCSDNTIPGKQVFYPIMFRLFNPKISGFQINPTNIFRSFDRDAGDWALYSFGPACVYSDDVMSVGGLNVEIKEWGIEDIQLFEAFLSRNDYDVIRVTDLGLLHIYHPRTNCDVINSSIQRLMCRDAMLSGLAAEESVVNYSIQKNYSIF